MLVINGIVVTVDKKRRILKDGAIAIQKDRIIDVGKTEELLSKFPNEEQLDARFGIVMPGLVDAHIHLPQALIRGSADDIPLKNWLSDRIWVLQGMYSAEDAQASSALCMLEMLKSGTTTFVDTLLAAHYGPDKIVELVLQSGMRGILAKSIMDQPGYAEDRDHMAPGMIEDKESCFRLTKELFERWNGKEGRVYIWLGPRPIGGVSPKTYKEAGELARELDTGMTWHFAEGDKSERQYVIDHFGLSPTEFAKQLGLLWERQLLGHCVWLDDKDISNIKKSGAHVCHLPTSNMKLGMGFAPIPEMLHEGVNVCLGTDGGPSGNAHDMFHVMNLAAKIHKGFSQDPAIVPTETLVEMATINGARAVGLEDEIGSLEPGKKADLIMLNPDSPNLVPQINPVSNIVYSATGHDVETVIIDGRIIVRDRVVQTLDENNILEEARRRATNLVERSGLDLGPEWPLD